MTWWRVIRTLICVTASIIVSGVHAESERSKLIVPEVPETPKRQVTIDDISALRRVDSLTVAPDGRRFAIFVRQGNAATNDFQTAWFVGDEQGNLTWVGDGGETAAEIALNGQEGSYAAGSEGRWSPDGQWIAYTLRRDGEVQLWRSRVDSTLQEPVTRNAADVIDFAWRKDGTALYFTTGRPRAELEAWARARTRAGYRYDEDLVSFIDLMQEEIHAPVEVDLSFWVVSTNGHVERQGNDADRIDWTDIQRRRSGAATPLATKNQDVVLSHCASAARDHFICVRETPDRPQHIVRVHGTSGSIVELADLNPEFNNIRLGKLERFSWATPRFEWQRPGKPLAGLYPETASGYILYPPDFDAKKKYPAVISPYSAVGFNNLTQWEQPLHVCAAQGMIVLDLSFPSLNPEIVRQLGDRLDRVLYSGEDDFPHLSMLMQSTLKALDTVAARGFIDTNRVGIAGMSHGTFVPLYLLQQEDRIAAISISSPHWGPIQYYLRTQKGDQSLGPGLLPKPQGAGAEYIRRIDMAEHVDEIEAPILMNLSDRETIMLIRLMRHMADAGKPYDAYIFPGEPHVKWQPAHLHAIMNRNLDWFRFWLQDYEDPAPSKRDQYAHWLALRKLQCRNPRALRDYCGIDP